MPTKKPIIAVVIDADTIKRIEDFQFENRFRNRSAAVVYLIRAGMKALANEHPELDESVVLETGKKSQVDGIDAERLHL